MLLSLPILRGIREKTEQRQSSQDTHAHTLLVTDFTLATKTFLRTDIIDITEIIPLLTLPIELKLPALLTIQVLPKLPGLLIFCNITRITVYFVMCNYAHYWFYSYCWNCLYFWNYWHCLKSVRIRSLSGSYFATTRSISLYSVRIQENGDQKNSKYGHFSRSVSHITEIIGISDIANINDINHITDITNITELVYISPDLLKLPALLILPILLYRYSHCWLYRFYQNYLHY